MGVSLTFGSTLYLIASVRLSIAPTVSGHRAGRTLPYRPAGANRHIQTATSVTCDENAHPATPQLLIPE